MRQIFSLPLLFMTLFVDFFKPEPSITPKQAATLQGIYFDLIRR